MKGTIKLTAPLLVNNKPLTELAYDTDKITVQHFIQADAYKIKEQIRITGGVNAAAEIDYGLHTYLGIMAIVAEMPEVDVLDVQRVAGADILRIMQVGRAFFTSKQAENSPPSGSENASGTTGGTTTPPKEKSTASD